MLERARKHELLPTDRIITLRGWSPAEVAAWKTARESGAAAYLTSAEQATFELANWDANTFNTNNSAATTFLGRAAMVINVGMLDRNAALPPVPHFDHIDDPRINKLIAQRSPGPELISRLTPAQIDRLEQDIQSAIFDDMWLLDDSGHLIDQAEEIPKQVHAD